MTRPVRRPARRTVVALAGTGLLVALAGGGALLARTLGRASREAARTSYDVVADRRSGKMSAENLREVEG